MNIILSYETTDLTLAAALRMHDVQLDRIVLTDNKRGGFFFNNVPMKLLEEYDLQQMKVEPFAFHRMIVALSTAVKRLRE